jgi:signal transduction histidine kinase
MRWLYFVVSLVLIGLLLALVWKARSVDVAQSDAIVAQLRELKQVDAAWNMDVLRARTGMTTSTDQAARSLPNIERLEVNLRQAAQKYWHDDPQARAQIVPKIDEFSTTMRQKFELIEQFKSQTAILHNSSQFLHTATQALGHDAQTSSAPIQGQIKFERLINQVYAGVMTYLQNPDDQRRERIQDTLVELQGLAPGLGERVGESTETVVAHVQSILHHRDSSNQLLETLTGLHTAAAIDKLTDAHTDANNERLKQLQIYQKALMAYCAFLLLLLAFMGYKLMRHYQDIQQTSDKLELAYADLKESQVHQVQSEKMSALGQMVAGIAHEINTPLAYLKATFNVIQEQLQPLERVVSDSHALALSLRGKPLGHEVERQLETVNQGTLQAINGGLFNELGALARDGIHGVDQISEIVINLKNFSRLDREKITDFSIENGLDSTLLLARNLIKYTITVVKDYGHVPSVVGAPSQINQVFLNLITNAAHAMPQRPVDENIIRLCTRYLAQEHMVQIEVEDNGKGIAPDALPKVFDPFYTTKPIGQGTGMGLSISYKIIQEHGGRIEVKSTQGVGTTFTVWLPIGGGHLGGDQMSEHIDGHRALVD